MAANLAKRSHASVAERSAWPLIKHNTGCAVCTLTFERTHTRVVSAHIHLADCTFTVRFWLSRKKATHPAGASELSVNHFGRQFVRSGQQNALG